MFTLHVGAGDGSAPNTDTIRFGVENIQLSAELLGLGKESEIGPVESTGEFSRETAAQKLTTLDTALQTVASSRAFLGAQQSRLGSTVNNLGIQVENLSAANSRIRDVDFADVTASFTQNRILQQAGASVLGQANSSQEIALSLLR
jgi:flagellin